MLVAYTLFFLLYEANSYKIPTPCPEYNKKLVKCVTDIVREHYSEKKVITYVGDKFEDEELLKAINNAGTVSIVSLKSTKRMIIPHEAYLLSGKNASFIAKHFPKVRRETSWNPLARFLVLVKNLTESDLKIVFDMFLQLHARHVIIVNATEDAHLYGYNPFDNYGCGKRYDYIFSYGKCAKAFYKELYVNKIITKLRNCTFNVVITQWPPYTILPTNDSNDLSPLRHGAEPYLFQLIGRMLNFKINITYDYTAVEEFPTVSTDMEAVGSLKKLQDNQADAAIGGMLLTPSRALAFSFVYGHLAYTDEIRFIVKRASDVPPWKNVYLEFHWTVWVILLLTLMLYSILVILLLQTNDKSYVVLVLLSNLLLHGHSFRSRSTVKTVLIQWMWFAYLVNTFYQSTLFSLTTNPAQEYQISNEEDLARFRLKPCFSKVMENYYRESVQSNDGYQRIKGCDGLMESVHTVANSEDLYTILLNGQFKYNMQEFRDKYGTSRVVALPKPYSKVMYAIFLYKGFPMINYFLHKSLRLRELGLVDKVIKKLTYRRLIKYRFHEKEFQTRFAIPWIIYVFGCSIAIITFIIEINMPRH
nr:uncharacterized protein LOC126054560 [Helicoverpa armigera]